MTAANIIALYNYGWMITLLVTLAILGDWVDAIPFYGTIVAAIVAMAATNIVFLWRQWLEVIRG